MQHHDKIAVFGSTGSVGVQALNIISHNKLERQVYALTAHSNWQLLAKQARQYQPKYVVIANDNYYHQLQQALATHPNITVLSGEKAIIDLASDAGYSIAIQAIVGMAGVLPTFAMCQPSKTIAIANKETIVCAGKWLMPLCQEHGTNLIPLDSEHNALYQIIEGSNNRQITGYTITASGGALRDIKGDKLADVTLEQVCNHPVWNMGQKICVDSASLMNKGLEVIEAHYLFNTNNISVLEHRQSIIHGMASFIDGTTMAVLYQPSMEVPIAHALNVNTTMQTLDLQAVARLTFNEPRYDDFPCLNLAITAMKAGGAMPSVLNIANEIAVDHFIRGKIKFTDIAAIIEQCLEHFSGYQLNTLTELFDLQDEVCGYIQPVTV
jgi:1-deoxy-D-xylulose-5-phosphate reductoisomerase